MTFFGVRSVVQHAGATYEERVVLLEAEDEDGAFVLAERELEEYCAALTDCRALGLLQSFRIDEGPIASGTEVFSLMRNSRLEPDEYLDRFVDTGDELAR